MRVLGARVFFQLFQLCPAEWTAWQHALDSFFDDRRWVTLQHFGCGRLFNNPHITSVAGIGRIVPHFTSGIDLLCIDRHDEVAIVYVRGIGRFVLSAKDACDLCRCAPYRLLCQVDDPPFSARRLLLLWWLNVYTFGPSLTLCRS